MSKYILHGSEQFYQNDVAVLDKRIDDYICLIDMYVESVISQRHLLPVIDSLFSTLYTGIISGNTYKMDQSSYMCVKTPTTFLNKLWYKKNYKTLINDVIVNFLNEEYFMRVDLYDGVRIFSILNFLRLCQKWIGNSHRHEDKSSVNDYFMIEIAMYKNVLIKEVLIAYESEYTTSKEIVDLFDFDMNYILEQTGGGYF